MSSIVVPPIRVQIAQNLPISNTGRVALLIEPLGSNGSADIVLQANQSTLLVPGNYQVLPKTIANLPTDPIAQISYDRTLQSFSVKVVSDPFPNEAQFSILLNLSNLAIDRDVNEDNLHPGRRSP